MSRKFNRSAAAAQRTLITILDHDALTIPAGDCLIGTIVTFDGTLATGTASQYLHTKGEYGTPANFTQMLNGTTGSNPGKFQNFINGNQSNACMAALAVEAGKSYFVGNIKLNGFFYTVICPVRTLAPVDGSTAIISASNTAGSRYVLEALDSATAWLIGGRSATDRQFDHSVSRFFIAEGTFSMLDIEKLAYGHEITELAVPRVYVRMDGSEEIRDIGPNALPLTTSGVLLQGADPGFGFVSQPVAPTITGKPTIIGSAKVNSTVTVTPAPMNGTPLPTAKWQWSIGGVDVAGATTDSYAIPPGDDTKALRARQIADNGVGTPATATSDPVVVTNGDVNITWAGLAAERICQRVAGAGCFIGLEGNWSGPTAPARMEMRLFAAHTGALSKDWFDAGGEFIAGGIWRARPWVPTPTHGKKYRAQLRALDANGNVLFTMAEPHPNRFGVGDIVAFIGSSSPTAWTGAGTGGGYTPDHDAVSTITGESTAPAWGLLGTYGAYIAMANYWAERENVPVAVFSAASSGTSLTDWAKADGGLFAAFKRFIAFAGGLLAAVVSSSGSNDAAAAGIVTGVDQHYGKIVAMVENTRSYTGQPELPFLWAGYNRRTDGRNPQSDYVRAAENRIGDYPFVYHVQSLDYPLVDNAHMPSSDAKRYCLERLMILLAEARKGNYMRGSEIDRMQSSSDGSVDVKFKHRGATALVANSAITGFRAYGMVDGAEVEWTGVAAAITANDTVRVTASGAITRLTYLEGNAPDIGTPLYSNTTPPLPVTAEAFMALTAAGEEVPDTTAPVMSGAISITNITTSGATLSFQAATDDVGVVGYEYSINGGTSYVNAGLSRSLAVSALTASTTYPVRARAYDEAGNRSAPLSASFTTLASEPPVEIVIDASKIPASRKVVFPGGTRVVPFGTKPSTVVPGAPYYRDGKWWSDKVPDDERYYVADLRVDLAEAGTTAVKAEAIPSGVKVLEQAVVQGSLIPVKLGGFDELRGALNFCTFRVTLANGEQIDRTLWFNKVDLQWVLEKDPEDKRYYVADVSKDLIDSNTTVTAVSAIPVGVAELVKPQMQGRLAVVKLGGMDTSADPLNYCKLRFECANGEKFFRTIHFKRVDN